MTLIKSILMSTPNYLLSLFTVLVLVANKIESMFKKRLWNDGPIVTIIILLIGRLFVIRWIMVAWDLGSVYIIIGLFLLNDFGILGQKEIVCGGR